MYKNITLAAFISAFMLTACGGGGSNTVPTSNASSSKALSSAIASSSKSSSVASSIANSLSSSVASAVSSANAPGETASSSSVVASSSSVAKSSSSSVASSSVVPPVSSSVASSSVKSSSSSAKSSSSSSSSSSVRSSSSVASSSSASSVSSGPASIYHVRGSFNEWKEGTLMLPTSTANVFELCVNFLPGDDAYGGPRFKIDPNGAYGDSVPAADYTVAAGWVKISFNSTTKAITTQQNLADFCPGASSSSSSVSSSVISSSSSSVASSSKSSSSSSVASSSKSSSSSSAPSSSSSSAASSAGPHHPGEDCASCHVAGGSAQNKIFTIAGTVYKADTKALALSSATPVHTAASIAIMDEADSTPTEVIRVQTNADGNFYSYASLGGRALSDLTPHAFGTAGAEMAMGSVHSSGSCNSCHNRTAPRAAPAIFVK